ncbi:hypothetical protein EIN_146130 [Entamoeba invadens IP1]|uniref:Rap-GAP domain-containing protein n=1 Tax=Entamoeba invadens IP1 TaxID=370355 RepID=L7FNA5_ENTIV|nr:hypothetical protein EIN_146130 [Entamoeba invadens IP1]ELP87619.1 hypothetical protein EIN_146130 [Entamoeba invadens IP1]|eukprot:XP_004254390.1 hypothetical protein EIN_146130 [Entamoeba invadens IP1]
MSKKQVKMSTPFQPVTEVKTDPKALKKYQQTFTGKDVTIAVKSLLSMMSLGQTVVPSSYFSSNTDALKRCLGEITNSIDNLLKKGGHSLSVQEIEVMLSVVKFSASYLTVNDISQLSPILSNFLCKDSNVEVRKNVFKCLLDLMKIQNNIGDMYGKFFLPSFNLRSFLTPEQEPQISENQVPTINSNSNVYCPSEGLDLKAQENFSITLIEIFFKELFLSQENFKLYSPLFHQLICCVIPNYQKIPTLSTLNVQHHFNTNDVPTRLYHKLGEEVMNAAKGPFSRMLVLDDRFLAILVHFYTEMTSVFKPNDKEMIESFLVMYKDFFFVGQSNLQTILKERLTTIQFKIIETPGLWFSQKFLSANLTNEATKSLMELIIGFYDKFALMEKDLTPSLKSTILSTVTTCSINFLQNVKNENYVPYKKELLNTLFILHLLWMQYEGDWLDLLEKLRPYFDVDVLTVIQNKLEHLTVALCQKIYHPSIFSIKLPIEMSEYITNLKVEEKYDTPHTEPKLEAIKTVWDVKRIREMWLLIFKFLDHPLQVGNVETVTKNIQILCELVKLLSFAEEVSTLEVTEDTSAPKPAMRQSQWNVQPTNWKNSRKTAQVPLATSTITAEQISTPRDNTFQFTNGLFLPIQELFFPILVEIIVKPQSMVTEASRCLCFKAVSRIASRAFPRYDDIVYDIFTSLVQSIHLQTIDVQWAFISSAYNIFSHPENKNIAALPSVIQSLSRLTVGSATLEDQVKCCSLISSLLMIEYNYPNLLEVFKAASLPLAQNYLQTLINIIIGALRIMSQPQTQCILYWCFANLYLIALEMKADVDFRIFLDIFFEGVRSPCYLIYTTSLQIVSYLAVNAKLIPENVVNYIVDALCNIILTCPITVDCVSFIFDVLSRWLLSYGKNLFSVHLIDETTHRLFQVIQMVLNTEEPPANADRPSTCVPPHISAQRFVALLSQVVFGDPTEHGMFKCSEANIPDQEKAKYFAYGESIISVLPSQSSHTRVFIRNMYGMYEFEVSPMQTLTDVGIPDIKDDFKPIAQIPWAKNNKETGIPKPVTYTDTNLLSQLIDDVCKDDASLMMCEFPEDVMKVDEYYQYINKVEEVMGKLSTESDTGVSKAIDVVDIPVRQLDLSDSVRNELMEYLQNILSLYSMNDKLLVPIEKTPSFLNELTKLDRLSGRVFFKSTIIYVGEEDFDFEKVQARSDVSCEYKQFMRSLGWYVDASSIACDPVLCQKIPDNELLYYADSQNEFVFEEVYKMQTVETKTMAEMSSLVHIVWDEGIKPYHPSLLGKQAEVVIVIKPSMCGTYSVNVFRKGGMVIEGPLMNNMIVTGDQLGKMVREQIINTHFCYLGNGYFCMDGYSNRFQQLVKLSSLGHPTKDYTLCKELQLILDEKNNEK